jgi:hypothetical protein
VSSTRRGSSFSSSSSSSLFFFRRRSCTYTIPGRQTPVDQQGLHVWNWIISLRFILRIPLLPGSLDSLVTDVRGYSRWNELEFRQVIYVIIRKRAHNPAMRMRRVCPETFFRSFPIDFLTVWLPLPKGVAVKKWCRDWMDGARWRLPVELWL